MELKIVEKDENPLLKRTEVRFEVDHAGAATPKRLDVRKQLAGELGVPEDTVVIEKFATMHGRQVASGIARAYDSRERLEELEPKHLLERGKPKEEKPEEKPPEEKPKEEKPPEKEEKPEEKPKEEKKLEEKPKEKPPEKEEKPKEEPKEAPELKKEEVKEKPPEKSKEEKGSGEEGKEKA